MNLEELAPLLAELDIDAATVSPIGDGWASWTFDVNDEYILRIARTPDIDITHRREARLLPELSKAVRFDVPVPIRFGEYRGRTYMTYRKLSGRPFQPGDDIQALGEMLRELHAFPVDKAARLLDEPGDAASWRAGYEEDWQWIQTLVLPVLDEPLRDLLGQRYFEAMDLLDDITPTLVHRDLGTVHILTDPATGKPTGIIDFETACIGDPAIDLIGALITLGDSETRRLAEAQPHDISWDRLRFYWWMGAVHAIRYGVENDIEAEIRDGIAGLRDRLGAGGTGATIQGQPDDSDDSGLRCDGVAVAVLLSDSASRPSENGITDR